MAEASLLTITYFVLVSSVNAGLAFLVLFRNRRHLVNRLFALTVTWVVLWTIGIFAGTGGGLIWKRFTFAIASLIPATFLLFARTFPSDRRLPRDPLVSLFVLLGVLISLTSSTPLIVANLSYGPRGLTILYGPLYPIFAAYFLLCFITSFYILWRKYRGLTGIERLRMRYLFLGTGLAVVGGATTNLVVPLLFRTSAFRLFGPAIAACAFAFVAHAILRYRLMHISLVVRKSVSYALAFLVSALLLFSGSFIAHRAIVDQLSEDTFLVTFVLGILVAVAFARLLRLFQSLFDRYIRRPAYDHAEVLQTAVRTLGSFLDQHDLFAYIWALASRTVKPEALAIYLLRSDIADRVYFDSATLDDLNYPSALDPQNALVATLRGAQEPLVREELGATFPEETANILGAFMTSNRWDMLVPIRRQEDLLGFVALGRKLSGDPYFTPDIRLFATIVRHAATVLTNAWLYAEVKTVKEYLEGILRHMESGVVAIDSAGLITTINPVALSLLGRPSTSPLAAHVTILPAPLAEPLIRALQTGEVDSQRDLELLITPERRAHLVLSTSVLRGLQHETLGAILVCSDHTRIKELELEKQRAERLVAFQSMAAGIAHEIKNPLVAIKTFAELLPDRFLDEEFREGFSKVVVSEIDRIANLVDRLRGIASPARQHLPPLDLRLPMNETVALLAPQLQNANIQVIVENDEDLPQIPGDHDQIKQLILNLILNAIEAISQDGTIIVRLFHRFTPRSSKLVLEVEDTGPGIPPHMLREIFDPFITTKARGSGLGLSICRGIADAHRATIEAVNQPSGAKVVLEFPTLSSAAQISSVAVT